MKKIILVIIILILPSFVFAGHFPENTIGRILLQVEENGEGWYVYPQNRERFYLGRPADAFEVMKTLGFGASHDFITNNEIFPERVSGYILLDVEKNGEAYYIYPVDLKKYYLGRPEDAFNIMRELGLGITFANLVNISIGDINNVSIPVDTGNKILYDVPFTSQAPFGDWADQRQQDGCEESSALMAMKWVNSESLSKEESLEKIINISDFLLEKYGEYRDISADDTVKWIFNDYFNYEKLEFKENILIDDIILELKSGNIVLAPMNGQLLGNPNFTHPGPIRHMLLIRGYDPATDMFITNDPGTRNGNAYEYSSDILFKSIRDYPTGYHEHIDEIEKNIIVVKK